MTRRRVERVFFFLTFFMRLVRRARKHHAVRGRRIIPIFLCAFCYRVSRVECAALFELFRKTRNIERFPDETHCVGERFRSPDRRRESQNTRALGIVDDDSFLYFVVSS